MAVNMLPGTACHKQHVRSMPVLPQFVHASIKLLQGKQVGRRRNKRARSTRALRAFEPQGIALALRHP